MKKEESNRCKAFAAAVKWHEGYNQFGDKIKFLIWFHVSNELPRIPIGFIAPQHRAAYARVYALLGKRQKDMGVRAGVYDYIFIWFEAGTGLNIGFLEAKADKGRLSDSQKQFKVLLDAAGIKNEVFVMPDEGINILKQWGIFK